MDFPDKDLNPEYDTHLDFEPIDPEHSDLEVTPEIGDNYIGANIELPWGGVLTKGKVIARKQDAGGNPIGHAHANPILDTREYTVEFDDQDVTKLTANKITVSVYTQCNPDVNQYLLLADIIDHRTNDQAIRLVDQNVVQADGQTHIRQSTAGWQLCCQWVDGSTSWESLSDLKELHPVRTAEYARLMGIDHELVFNLWVMHVLKKHNRILLLIKRHVPQYLKGTHKFGIEVPDSVKDALELDSKNGNTVWADAIATEMKYVQVAFKILPDGTATPIGYQKISCHMIFDVKMEDFRRKARLVAGGHQTEAPATITYASVISCEMVCLGLTIATLNDLEEKFGDVLNAYITAQITEKVWTLLGPEFGPDAGKTALITRALYELKSAGSAFRAHLASS